MPNTNGLTLSQIAEMINDLGDDDFLEMFMELAIVSGSVKEEAVKHNTENYKTVIDTFTKWLNTVLHEINEKEGV